MATTYLLTGETFPARDALKAAGAVWDGKAWWLDEAEVSPVIQGIEALPMEVEEGEEDGERVVRVGYRPRGETRSGKPKALVEIGRLEPGPDGEAIVQMATMTSFGSYFRLLPDGTLLTADPVIGKTGRPMTDKQDGYALAMRIARAAGFGR